MGERGKHNNNSGEQVHQEICGGEREGVVNTGKQDEHSRDFQEGKEGI